MQTSKPLILASGSPRRKELMQTLGLPFQVLVSDVDESFLPSLSPEMVPALLAERKALEVLKIRPEALVLASDTVVVLDGKILNKPLDLEEAKEMLTFLSGKVHQVFTAFTLAHADSKITQTDRAEVFFKVLSEEETDHYLNTGKPMDKAGAYGIQEWIGLVAVERIEGSYFTVMGLPTHLVWNELKKYLRA
jgi:septum formation protein